MTEQLSTVLALGSYLLVWYITSRLTGNPQGQVTAEFRKYSQIGTKIEMRIQFTHSDNNMIQSSCHLSFSRILNSSTPNKVCTFCCSAQIITWFRISFQSMFLTLSSQYFTELHGSNWKAHQDSTSITDKNYLFITRSTLMIRVFSLRCEHSWKSSHSLFKALGISTKKN